MRTTVTLDDDVEAAIDRLQRERGLGRSEALNLLARRGMMSLDDRSTYIHRAEDIGIRIDLANLGETLDLLDGS